MTKKTTHKKTFAIKDCCAALQKELKSKDSVLCQKCANEKGIDQELLIKHWNQIILGKLIAKLKGFHEKASQKLEKIEGKALKARSKKDTTPQHDIASLIGHIHPESPHVKNCITKQLEVIGETYPNLKLTFYQYKEVVHSLDELCNCLSKEEQEERTLQRMKRTMNPNNYKVHIEEYKAKKAVQDVIQCEQKLHHLFYVFHQINEKRMA
jgi:hypothetical protein